MLSLDTAEARDIESLRNWSDGTGCIAREETAYLAHSRELASLAPSKDSALLKLEIWVEDVLIRFYRGFRDVRKHISYQYRLTKGQRIVITIFQSIQKYTYIPAS